MIIFLDMDDVLCKFVDSACAVHGVDPQMMKDLRHSWDIRSALSTVLELDQTMSHSVFWNAIDEKGVGFWSDMPKYDWIEELIDLVQSYADEWYVVTSPSSNPSCYAGKRQWIQKNLGYKFNHTVFTKHKHLLSSKGRVLIDDSRDNLSKFVSNGGTGILFPTGHEFHRKPVPDVISYVSRALQSIKESNHVDG